MPYSDIANKDWIVEKIRQIAPENILDVGVGAGNLEYYVRSNLETLHL